MNRDCTYRHSKASVLGLGRGEKEAQFTPGHGDFQVARE